MATPDRDNLYSREETRTVYTRESNGTGWFVGIIVALALLAIGYLVFSANTDPNSAVNPPATTTPIESTEPVLAPSPVTEAPAPAAETTVAPVPLAAPELAPAPVPAN